MSSYIKTPVALNAIGSRDNNEDYIYPLMGEADLSSRLFMVCDGMGGPKKGEVAAKLVSESFVRDINSFPPDGKLYKGYLEETLVSTEEALSSYMKAYPESIGMGTTMAMAYLQGNQANLAWVGNSRIFHYNFKERKLSVTEASELGSSQDSLGWPSVPQVIHGTETPTKLQYQVVDLHHGDYLFICTDGILEQIDEGVLHTLFGTGAPPEKLIEEIKTLCEGSTQDNYSCYMIQMDLEDTPIEVTAIGSMPPVVEVPQEETSSFDLDENTDEEDKSSTTEPKEEEKQEEIEDKRVNKQFVDIGAYILVGVLLVGMVGLAGYFINQWMSSTPYKNYMTKAQKLESEEKYQEAIAFYDSAYDVAEQDAEKEQAIAAKEEAQNTLNALQPEATELIAKGKTAYGDTNYSEAITNLENALATLEKNGATVPDDFPYEELARSYVFVADEEFAKAEKTVEDEERVLSYYEKASDIYGALRRKGAQIADESFMDRAHTRGFELTNKLSVLATREGQTGRGIPANNIRPVESPEKKQTSQKTSTPTQTTNKPKTSTRKVTPSKTSSNKTSARSVAPASNISATLTANTPGGQHLIDGKNLYNKAKAGSDNASYEYRMAAEHLKLAGDELDGAGAYLLAYMYHKGLGMDANADEALRYAQKSANMGWAGGYYLYAYCLLQRKNKVDSANAVKSLKKAAAKKHQPSIDLLKKLGE